MDPMETILNEFSTTVHLKVDKLQHVRKVLSKLSEYKYNATSDKDLADKIGLTSKVRNHIINDFFLVKYLIPRKDGCPIYLGNTESIANIKLHSIPRGILARWLLDKPEFDALALFQIYIENKSYEQIAKEIIILDVEAILQIQIKHINNLYKDLFAG